MNFNVIENEKFNDQVPCCNFQEITVLLGFAIVSNIHNFLKRLVKYFSLTTYLSRFFYTSTRTVYPNSLNAEQTGESSCLLLS